MLIILERVGKATRNPPRDAMLAHAGRHLGAGWAFGVHEALDQFGATFGPLLVALVLSLHRHDYKLAFALLAIPAVIELCVLAVARITYPQPADLEQGAPAVPPGPSRLPRRFWVYLTAAALIGAGFADFPLIAYHFERARIVSTDTVPIYYAVAMAVGGAGSLIFGRLFDRFGIKLLLPLTIAAAGYAPLVFLGGSAAGLVGIVLWGVGSGVQESIIPAAVGQMVSADHRASAFGIFTGIYGVAWFAGSTVIGLLFGVSLTVVVVFSLASQLLALLPFAMVLRRPAT